MPTGKAQPTQRAPHPNLGLPQGVSYSAQVVVDRQTQGFSGKEGTPASGLAQVFMQPPAIGQGYLIERIDVSSNSSTTSAVNCYVGAPAPQNEVEFTPAGNHDVADESHPIYVPPGQIFTVIWSGLSAGAVVAARIQWTVIEFFPATYGAPSGGG